MVVHFFLSLHGEKNYVLKEMAIARGSASRGEREEAARVNIDKGRNCFRFSSVGASVLERHCARLLSFYWRWTSARPDAHTSNRDRILSRLARHLQTISPAHGVAGWLAGG